MKSTNVFRTALVFIFLLSIPSVLTAKPSPYETDRYDTDSSITEGTEYMEGLRRELFVQFRPDSPLKGCRRSSGGGGG